MKDGVPKRKAALVGGFSWGLLALAFHPVAFIPLVFCGLVPWLVWLQRRQYAGLATSLFAGLTVYGALIMFWVSEVVGWAGPVGWIILVMLWALLSIPVIGFLNLLLGRWKGSLFWVLPSTLVAQDVFRSWALGGISWQPVGYALADWTLLIQVAEIGGVWCVSWLALATNVVVAEWWVNGRNPRHRTSLILKTALVVAAALGALAFGAWRLDAIDEQLQPGPRVVGLQGNIQQDMKIYSGPRGWQAMRDRHFALYHSEEANRVRPDLIIWPETSLKPGWNTSSMARTLGGYIAPESLLAWRPRGSKDSLGEQLRPSGTLARDLWPSHLIGLITCDDHPKPVEGTRTRNTVAFFVPGVAAVPYELSDVYHKRELVPFGEYLPLPDWFPWREPLEASILDAAGFIPDMTRGEKPSRPTLKTNRGRWLFDVNVCFEMVFPQLFQEAEEAGADFFVNVSNDAWYGESAELDLVHRHGIFRSIENRLSLVRVSNTGISTVLDPAGREIAVVEANGKRKNVGGTLVSEVPVGASRLFRFGRRGFQASLFLGLWLLIAVGTGLRRPRQGVDSCHNLAA